MSMDNTKTQLEIIIKNFNNVKSFIADCYANSLHHSEKITEKDLENIKLLFFESIENNAENKIFNELRNKPIVLNVNNDITFANKITILNFIRDFRRGLITKNLQILNIDNLHAYDYNAIKFVTYLPDYQFETIDRFKLKMESLLFDQSDDITLSDFESFSKLYNKNIYFKQIIDNIQMRAVENNNIYETYSGNVSIDNVSLENTYLILNEVKEILSRPLKYETKPIDNSTNIITVCYGSNCPITNLMIFPCNLENEFKYMVFDCVNPKHHDGYEIDPLNINYVRDIDISPYVAFRSKGNAVTILDAISEFFADNLQIKYSNIISPIYFNYQKLSKTDDMSIMQIKSNENGQDFKEGESTRETPPGDGNNTTEPDEATPPAEPPSETPPKPSKPSYECNLCFNKFLRVFLIIIIFGLLFGSIIYIYYYTSNVTNINSRRNNATAVFYASDTSV